MTQVQGSFTVNVKPAASGSPIKIEPNTGALPDEQVGVAVVGDKLATVSGGVAPYTYSFEGQPNGMTFDEKDNGDGSFDVLIMGTPSVGDDDPSKTPYTVVMTVNDSSNPSASTRRSLSVR